jgi:hypothetical protein
MVVDGQPIINAAKASTSTTAPHVEWQPRQLNNGTWVEDPTQWDPKANGGQGGYVPAPGLAPKPIKDPRGEPKEPKAPTFQTIQGTTYAVVTDPGGGYHLELPKTPPGANKEPYDDIVNGIQVHMVWNEGEGKYKPDPTVAPVPWSPQAKADAAKAASQPVEGNTRSSIDRTTGRNITETYLGGEWVPTGVGARAIPMDPKVLTPSTDAPFTVTTDENGQPVYTPNQNYQGPKAPTTRGELAQRVALLQTQAQQMMEKIRADKSIPADQQATRFSQWYDENIKPQVGALDQQQQAIIADEAQKATAAYQAQVTAAANAIQSTAPYRVGPNFASSFEQGLNRLANIHGGGKTPVDFTGSVGFKGPNIDQGVQTLLNTQAVQPPPGMDFNSLLNRNQWFPGGGQPPGPAGPAGPVPTGPAAGGPPPAAPGTDQYSVGAIPGLTPGGLRQGTGPYGTPPSTDPTAALRARLAADTALQARQAAVPQPVPQQAPPPVPLASASPMPLATGAGPLAYANRSAWRPPVPPPMPAPIAATGAPGLVPDAANPYAAPIPADAAARFSALIPYLNSYDPTQPQTQWDWSLLTPG